MNRSVKRANIPVSIRTRMEKIYNYIKYCQRLEDAYRTKHEEVKTLNEYLKRIQRVLPDNVSDNCPEVSDIITYIEGLPEIPDTDDLHETLKRMIDQQKQWRDESTRNYNLINRKIESLTEARDVLSTENIPVEKKEKDIVVNGVRVIPFYKVRDEFSKYGGSFLSSYQKLENPIELTFEGLGKFKFECVSSAYLSQELGFMDDKKRRNELIKSLSKTGLDYDKINGIRDSYIKDLEKNKAFKRKWETESLKHDVMLNLTKLKFEINPKLAEKLKDTGDSYLIQISNNFYWGSGTNGAGKNKLGKILMNIRNEMFGFKSNYSGISIRDIVLSIGKRVTFNSKKNSKPKNTRKNTPGIVLKKGSLPTRANRRSRKKSMIRRTKKRVLGKKK